MMNLTMLYTASIVITLWGVAHIVPTKQVVAGFGPLSSDNRRILTMEWVAEGVTLCFLGVLTFLVTVMGLRSTEAGLLVYRACAFMLLLMALWTGITGGRTSTAVFKICPVVKTGAAVLLLVGSTL